MARPVKPLERTSTGEAYRGSRIRELREAKGLSRERMADLLGYNRDSLTKVETNGGNPSRRRLVKIAEVLGIPLEELQRAPVHPRLLRKKAAVLRAPLSPSRQKILLHRLTILEKKLQAVEHYLHGAHAAEQNLREAQEELRELQALAAEMFGEEERHADT